MKKKRKTKSIIRKVVFIIEKLLTVIGIGGIIGNLQGWREIFKRISIFFEDFSIVQFLLGAVRNIFLIYQKFLESVFFWVPYGIREHVMVLLFLFLPFLLKRLGLIKEYSRRMFEFRFNLIVISLWIAIDINNYYFGITGFGENVAWGLGWVFIVYFPFLFFLDLNKRFKILVFSLIWSMWWIIGNSGPTSSVSNNPTESLFYSYPAILLMVSYTIVYLVERKKY